MSKEQTVNALQGARQNLASALDSLSAMPYADEGINEDGTVTWNAAHHPIMCGVLQRIDYELHALQNSLDRRQGTYPHEDYPV